MFALFNENKEFVAFSDENFPDFPTLNIFKLEIPKDQEDLTKWKWEGDMFNGKMVKIKD